MLSNEKASLSVFYKKRFLNIYPMFWIAFLAATVLARIMDGGLPALPRWKMLISLAGYDGYLNALRLLHGSFYQVGEWFLGCVITLYIFWPVLRRGMRDAPVVTWIVSLLLNVMTYAVYKPGWVYQNWFFVRFPELLFGMTVVKYRLDRYPLRFLGGTLVCAAAAFMLPGEGALGAFCRTVSFCAVLFALLMNAGRLIKSQAIKEKMVFVSGLTYPIFLVHHWIISRIAKGFDLSILTRRKTAALYVIYLIVTAAAAWLLKTAGAKISKIV